MQLSTLARIGLAAALACSPAFTSYACDQNYKLVLTSEAHDRDSVVGKAMRKWAKLIKEKSNGRMRVEIFYA